MVNVRNAVRHFWPYLRGVLRGHPGARIGRGVRLTGPGIYELHRGCTITDGARFWVGPGARLVMHGGSKIGDRSVVNVESGVVLGPGVRVSWDVQILDTDFHWIRGADGRVRRHTSPITLEERVLVGARATVLKGVTIGAGSVVGSGAVVRSAVPAGTIVAGNPAVVVGEVAEWGSARGRVPD